MFRCCNRICPFSCPIIGDFPSNGGSRFRWPQETLGSKNEQRSSSRQFRRRRRSETLARVYRDKVWKFGEKGGRSVARRFFPSVPRDCVARVEASRFEVNKTKFKVCSKLSRMYNARCPPPPPPLLLLPAPVCIALRPRQFSYRLPSLT